MSRTALAACALAAVGLVAATGVTTGFFDTIAARLGLSGTELDAPSAPEQRPARTDLRESIPGRRQDKSFASPGSEAPGTNHDVREGWRIR